MGDVFKIFEKELGSRSKEDIDEIIDFLMTLDSFIYIIKNSNERNMREILCEIAKNMPMEFNKNRRVLFRFGEKAKMCYLVLNGCASVLLPKAKKVLMSEVEYLRYLYKLRMNGEIELMNLVSTINENVYQGQEVLQVTEENTNENINENNNEKENEITVENYIERTYPDYITSSLLNTKKKVVTVYVYQLVNEMKKGEIFGDFALDSRTKKYSATIILDEKTQVGILYKSFYEKFFKAINERSRNSFLSFISTFSIFENFPQANFEKKYFNQFKFRKYANGDKLFSEGLPFNHIIFIKSGDYEITTYRSVMEINKLIYHLKNEHYTISENQIEENISDLKTVKDDAFIKSFLTKKLLKISIVKDREMLGLFELMENVNKKETDQPTSMFTITCKSFNGEAYILPIEHFLQLYSNEESLKKEIDHCFSMKKQYLIEKLKHFKKIQYEINKNLFSYDKEKMRMIFPKKNKIDTPVKKNFFSASNLPHINFGNNNLSNIPSIRESSNSKNLTTRMDETPRITEKIKIKRSNRRFLSEVKNPTNFINPCLETASNYITIETSTANVQDKIPIKCKFKIVTSSFRNVLESQSAKTEPCSEDENLRNFPRPFSQNKKSVYLSKGNKEIKTKTVFNLKTAESKVENNVNLTGKFKVKSISSKEMVAIDTRMMFNGKSINPLTMETIYKKMKPNTDKVKSTELKMKLINDNLIRLTKK